MEENRLFKFLWRANAIFLFLGGALLIGILLISAIVMLADFRNSDAPPPTISADAERLEGNEAFRIETPSRKYRANEVEGFVYFELRSGTDSYAKFSSGESSQLRNIGVFDLKTDEIHWVFPDAQQEVESFYSVTKSILDEKNQARTVTTGFLLTIAKSLSDGRIERDLWVMTPNGKNLRKILPNISRRPDIETYGENKVKLVMETDSKIDIYPFDVDTLRIGTPTEITIP